MSDDDLNEWCEDKYCGICGPPVAADHYLPDPYYWTDSNWYGAPQMPWEDDE